VSSSSSRSWRRADPRERVGSEVAPPVDTSYRVSGGQPLRGVVTLSGSKNAVLPCLSAALLTEEEVVIRNVPDIADVRTMLSLFEALGVTTSFTDGTVRVCAKHLRPCEIPHDLVKRFRASILFLGPFLARFGEVRLPYPGGDVIGKRPVQAHIHALRQLGAEDRSVEDEIHLVGRLHPTEVILPEFSVTATENVLLPSALLDGPTAIRLAACEPHVQNLCTCLTQLGVRVDGRGTHDLVVHGGQVHGGDHTVATDYLEAGFFILAALLTDGWLRLERVHRDDLLSFLTVVESVAPGAVRFLDPTTIQTCRRGPLQPCAVRTNVFPGFPTDLLPLLGVAVTQSQGVSRLFERLYEGRFGYLYELEKMGAKVEILNAHEALVIGPTRLRGRTVTSHDIRAGAAMILAALVAEGETIITDVRYIDRGFDHLDGKLREVGAIIERK